MITDIKKHRRQVAWVCFEPYLAQDQLIRAIQILEQSYQIDNISNLIAYVTKICSEFSIDIKDQKLLYGQFYKMMSEPLELLIDPLSFVFEKEINKATIATTDPKPVQLQAKPIPATIVPQPALTASMAEATNFPDHTLIFKHFVKQLIAYLPDTSDLLTMLNELVEDEKQMSKELADIINRWKNNLDDFAWTEGLDEKTLAGLVHQIYMGLCDVLGPIGADESFHKAIASCEQLPEARRFPPSRFL